MGLSSWPQYQDRTETKHRLTVTAVLRQFSPVYTTKIHFNIILHRVQFSKLSLSTKLPKQNWICICCFQKVHNFVNAGMNHEVQY